ncbi:hypothetical protein [Bacteroides sp.]|uniref:hypothetical protein n=1 Tax=Bacteroides sp. TaxID=29523 RepID=UPI002628EF1B|nr:hypothetical protein [Bacteroides sp.]MDD3039100.1 hypothetical protein [Bacteroides sp.]
MYESEELNMMHNANKSLDLAIELITTGLWKAREALYLLKCINPELAKLAEEGWYNKTAELFDYGFSPIKSPKGTLSDIKSLIAHFSNPLYKECYFKILNLGPFKGYIREENYDATEDPIMFDFMESTKILSTIYGFDNTKWVYDRLRDEFISVESDPNAPGYFKFPFCHPIRINDMKIKTYQIKIPNTPWIQIMPIPETTSED